MTGLADVLAAIDDATAPACVICTRPLGASPSEPLGILAALSTGLAGGYTIPRWPPQPVRISDQLAEVLWNGYATSRWHRVR